MPDENTASQHPVDGEVPVDETPISPSQPNAQRKNSLVQHLMHRPERGELVQSMTPNPTFTRAPRPTPDGGSGTMRPTQQTPAPKSTKPKVCHLLNPRAENILPATTAAPSLQAHQKEVS